MWNGWSGAGLKNPVGACINSDHLQSPVNFAKFAVIIAAIHKIHKTIGKTFYTIGDTTLSMKDIMIKNGKIKNINILGNGIFIFVNIASLIECVSTNTYQ